MFWPPIELFQRRAGQTGVRSWNEMAQPGSPVIELAGPAQHLSPTGHFRVCKRASLPAITQAGSSENSKKNA